MRTIIATILFLTACGEVSLPGSSSDGGGGGDGGGDAGEPGPVSVTVQTLSRWSPKPIEGVPVGFFSPAGAHQATVMTDAGGVATADLLPGGSVVAFLEAPATLGGGTKQARAVLDVRPGDQIVIQQQGELAVLAVMDLNLPMLSGAGTYHVFSSCTYTPFETPATLVRFYDTCELDEFSYVAVADAGSGPQYVLEADIPIEDTGVFDEPGAWSPLTTPPVVFTDLPAGAAGIQLELYGTMVGSHQIGFGGAVPGDSIELTDQDMVSLRPARIPGQDVTVLRGNVTSRQAGFGGVRFSRSVDSRDTSPWALDEMMPPWMGPVAYQASRRALSWRLVGEQEFDATYLTLVLTSNIDDQITEAMWFITAPPGIEEIVLPELPDDLADWFQADPEFSYSSGEIMASDVLDGWEAARPLGFYGSFLPIDLPAGSTVSSALSAVVSPE